VDFDIIGPGLPAWSLHFCTVYNLSVGKANLLEFSGMSERPPWYIYLPLLVFPFLLFAPIILSGRALFWGTPLTQFIPWWNWSWDAILQGFLPVWNDLLGMGAPLIANYQSALFYPPTWLYFFSYLVGGISAMAWFQAVMVVLHLAWASFGMALLIRQLRLGTLAQVVGGMAFGLSGYLVSRAGFLSINAAVAWMPWVILGVTKLFTTYFSQSWCKDEKAATKGNSSIRLVSAYLLLVGSLAMQLLSGHAQTTWYTILLAFSWFLYLVLSHRWKVQQVGEHQESLSSDNGSEKEDQQTTVKDRSRTRRIIRQPKVLALLLFGSTLVFAFGLAAVQLLPTAEYLLQSQRSSAVDYDFAMSYSFWPWRFLSFIAPDLFGNPAIGDYWGYANYWEDAIYFGLIPFFLAVAAAVTRGRQVKDTSFIGPRFIWFLLILILTSFVIALGRNTPIFPWLYRKIPTFDMFQAPTRISILAVFSLSVLAAIGADSWHRPREKLLYWLRLGIMAAAAITVGAGLALLVSRSLTWGIRPSFIRATALLGIWGIGLGVLTLKAPEKGNTQLARSKWGWWQWAVVIWVGLDLIVSGWGLNPSVELNLYSQPSPTAEEVKSMLDGGRLYLTAEDEEQLKFDRFLRFDTFRPFEAVGGWQDLRAVQLPNVTLLDSIPSVNNFDPLLPGRYSNWMGKLSEVDLETQDRMLNLMGVTVVETIDLSQPYGVRFESQTAYPRFRWVTCGLQVESGDEALKLVTQNQANLESMVILEMDQRSPKVNCADQITPEIRINTSSASKVKFEIFSENPGYLVIADVWYPGWRAFVDGDPTPVLRANYLFRAIAIPDGAHEVMVVYQPKWFYSGAAISGITSLGIIILGSYWLRKRSSVKVM
jgi:hypothetical protein